MVLSLRIMTGKKKHMSDFLAVAEESSFAEEEPPEGDDVTVDNTKESSCPHILQKPCIKLDKEYSKNLL